MTQIATKIGYRHILEINTCRSIHRQYLPVEKLITLSLPYRLYLRAQHYTRGVYHQLKKTIIYHLKRHRNSMYNAITSNIFQQRLNCIQPPLITMLIYHPNVILRFFCLLFHGTLNICNAKLGFTGAHYIFRLPFMLASRQCTLFPKSSRDSG